MEAREDDLVKDLRKNARYCPTDTRIPILLTEAADKIERLLAAIEYVVTRFERDEAQGYHTKDREFAITILRKALSQ